MFVHVPVAIISENVALECQSSEANTGCRHSKSNSHSKAEEASGADDNHTLTPDTITRCSSTQFWSYGDIIATCWRTYMSHWCAHISHRLGGLHAQCGVRQRIVIIARAKRI